MTTYNAFGGYGHPDHIRTHDVAVRAFERAGDPAWYPEQLERGRASTTVGAVEALRAGDPGVGPDGDGGAAARSSARSSFWEPPEDATPEQIAEFEEFAAKMLVPDETITTWLDISGDAARRASGTPSTST